MHLRPSCWPVIIVKAPRHAHHPSCNFIIPSARPPPPSITPPRSFRDKRPPASCSAVLFAAWAVCAAAPMPAVGLWLTISVWIAITGKAFIVEGFFGRQSFIKRQPAVIQQCGCHFSSMQWACLIGPVMVFQDRMTRWIGLTVALRAIIKTLWKGKRNEFCIEVLKHLSQF